MCKNIAHNYSELCKKQNRSSMQRTTISQNPIILSADVIRIIRDLPEDERQAIARTFTNVVILSQNISEQNLTPFQMVIWTMINSSLQSDSRRILVKLNGVG